MFPLLFPLRLNEKDLIRESAESVPHGEIELLVADLPVKYVGPLARFVAEELESSPHLHFYSKWARQILLKHGVSHLKQSRDLGPTLNLLHKNLLVRAEQVSRLCQRNSRTMDFLLTMAKMRKAKVKDDSDEEEEEEEMESEKEEEEEELSSGDEGMLASNWVE